MSKSRPFFLCLFIVISCMFATPFLSCGTTKSAVSLEPSYKLRDVTHRPTRFIENAYNSSVSIMSLEKGQLNVRGAGVILKKKKGHAVVILTAWHVPRNIWKKDGVGSIIIAGVKKTGSIILTKVYSYSEEEDLALLVGIKAEKEDGPFVRLAEALPEIGSSVWVIGAPTGKERNISTGILSNVILSGVVHYYRTDAAVYFGNSGGGMFDSRGELIGIADAVSISPPGFLNIVVPGSGLAVGLPNLRGFLKKSLK